MENTKIIIKEGNHLFLSVKDDRGILMDEKRDLFNENNVWGKILWIKGMGTIGVMSYIEFDEDIPKFMKKFEDYFGKTKFLELSPRMVSK